MRDISNLKNRLKTIFVLNFLNRFEIEMGTNELASALHNNERELEIIEIT